MTGAPEQWRGFVVRNKTAERGGADFWFMPRHFAPYSLTTDERLGWIL